MSLSKNTRTQVIDDFKYATRDIVAGAIHIYEGALLNSDASGNVKLSTDAASEKFAGVATEEINQAAAASAADNNVKVIAANSGKVVRIKLTSVTKADIGKLAYASADDAVLLSSGTNAVIVGRIVNIDPVANYCWIKLTDDLDTDT